MYLNFIASKVILLAIEKLLNKGAVMNSDDLYFNII